MSKLIKTCGVALVAGLVFGAAAAVAAKETHHNFYHHYHAKQPIAQIHKKKVSSEVEGAITTPLSFVSIGDWGCAGTNVTQFIGYEHAVAKQFMLAAADGGAQFVLNTGDNFYWCGVARPDDPQFQYAYEAIFDQPSMMVPWYGCLGNHDYGFARSAEYQVAYRSEVPASGAAAQRHLKSAALNAATNAAHTPGGRHPVGAATSTFNRWQIPHNYYYERMTYPVVDASGKALRLNISLVVLDASPCMAQYRGNNASLWDPCSDLPNMGCEPSPIPCRFHQNILEQSCTAQYAWLAALLPQIAAEDWLIVMSHAPANEFDIYDMTALLQAADMDLYVNGHVHNLAQYQVDGYGTYITTGGGCMVPISPSKGDGSSCTKRFDHSVNHTCEVLWEEHIAGYTTHTFASDYQSIVTNFFDATGNLLHSATATKNNTPPPADGNPQKNIQNGKKKLRSRQFS